MSEPTVTPLTAEEEALFREGLAVEPMDESEYRGGLPLAELTRREWRLRCLRLLATLDAARAFLVVRDRQPAIPTIAAAAIRAVRRVQRRSFEVEGVGGSRWHWEPEREAVPQKQVCPACGHPHLPMPVPVPQR